MRIYIAAAYPHQTNARLFALWLKAHGYEVVSQWIYSELDDDELTGEEMSGRAAHNVADLFMANCVIIFTEAPGTEYVRGGRHVETGIALALSRYRRLRLILVGPRENIFHHLLMFEHYQKLELLKVQLLMEIE